MKRIGITQRVVYREDIEERRDVLDQRWYDFANELSVQLIPIPNNLSSPINYIEVLHIDGIILSGGNNIGIDGEKKLPDKTIQKDDVAYERDQTEMNLLKWAENKQKPIIGVCRGLQFINAFYGGSQTKVDPEKHVAKHHQVDVIEKEWQQIFGTSMDVNSYHNWGVLKRQLADKLNPTVTVGNYVEGFRGLSNKLFGIMWHPERYNEFRNEDIELFKKIFDEV